MSRCMDSGLDVGRRFRPNGLRFSSQSKVDWAFVFVLFIYKQQKPVCLNYKQYAEITPLSSDSIHKRVQ